MRSGKRLSGLVVCCALGSFFLAGCGGDDDPGTPPFPTGTWKKYFADPKEYDKPENRIQRVIDLRSWVEPTLTDYYTAYCQECGGTYRNHISASSDTSITFMLVNANYCSQAVLKEIDPTPDNPDAKNPTHMQENNTCALSMNQGRLVFSNCDLDIKIYYKDDTEKTHSFDGEYEKISDGVEAPCTIVPVGG